MYQLGDSSSASTTTTAPETATVDLSAKILERSDAIFAWTQAEDRRRKIALLVTIGGAIFAAARLGFIAIPWIKSIRKRPALGELGETTNPARRSRSRRRRRRR